jgi:hypothetical protein
MSDERVWLKHTETGHLFPYPAGAAKDFGDLGWAPTDERPPEDNPVIAERLAWEAEQRAAAQAAAAGQPPEQPITAPAGSAPESEE